LADAGIQNSNMPHMEQLTTAYFTLIQMILEQNTTIPVIIVEPDGSFNYHANIRISEGRREQVLNKELAKMKSHADPIRIDLSDEDHLLLYYHVSNLLRNLRYYPFIQLFVIIIFIIAAYSAFLATQRAEQNQVWVGMS